MASADFDVDCTTEQVSLFVKTYEHAGIFNEEGFEKFQRVSNKTRSLHTHKKPVESQINKYVQYLWLICIPKVL